MKNLLLGFLLLLLVFVLNGQDNKISMNLEFGPSTTNLIGSGDLYDKIPTTNFLIGYRVEYGLTKWLSYNIGLLYDRKGQNYKYPLRDDNNNVIIDAPPENWLGYNVGGIINPTICHSHLWLVHYVQNYDEHNIDYIDSLNLLQQYI